MLEEQIKELTAEIAKLTKVLDEAMCAFKAEKTITEVTSPEVPKTNVAATPAKKAKAKTEPAPAPEAVPEAAGKKAAAGNVLGEDLKVTLDDIRKVAKQLVVADGDQKRAAELLAKYKVVKIPDLQEKDLDAVYADFTKALEGGVDDEPEDEDTDLGL